MKSLRNTCLVGLMLFVEIIANHVMASTEQTVPNAPLGEIAISLDYASSVSNEYIADFTLYKSGMCIYLDELPDGSEQLMTITLTESEIYSLIDEVIQKGFFDIASPRKTPRGWMPHGVQIYLHLYANDMLHELSVNSHLTKKSRKLRRIVKLLTGFSRDDAKPYYPTSAILSQRGTLRKSDPKYHVERWPLPEDCMEQSHILLEGKILDKYLAAAGHRVDSQIFESTDRIQIYRYIPLLPDYSHQEEFSKFVNIILPDIYWCGWHHESDPVIFKKKY